MADQKAGRQDTWDRIAHRAIEGPLAKITIALEALAADGKSTLAPASRQAVQSSIVTAHRLQDMLESLLAVEELSTGAATMDPVPVSLGIALEPVLRALDARAKAEGITFAWTANEVGLAVAADEDLLRRAFRLATERVMDDVPKGGSVRASAATGGGSVRLRVTGSAPTDEAAPFSVSEPVEIGFA